MRLQKNVRDRSREYRSGTGSASEFLLHDQDLPQSSLAPIASQLCEALAGKLGEGRPDLIRLLASLHPALLRPMGQEEIPDGIAKQATVFVCRELAFGHDGHLSWYDHYILLPNASVRQEFIGSSLD
jgi:hypothetical protein